MPTKLIFFIAVIVCISVFTGANLDNKADISVIFYTFKDIPVFLAVLYSFCAGVLVTLPFTFGKKNKNKVEKIDKKEKIAKNKDKTADIQTNENIQ